MSDVEIMFIFRNASHILIFMELKKMFVKATPLDL